MANDATSPKKKLNLWLIVLFVSLLFTGLLWDRYFNSAVSLDRVFVSNLILLTGTLFSVSCAFFAWTLETRRDQLEILVARRTKNLSEKNEELERAMGEIKTLRGFIPICAGCKKIRDDQGLWQQIELYIQNHSEAVFSHGMCKDCVRKHYPSYRKGPR